MTILRIVTPLNPFLFEHDLFGKPVSTFPDHALAPAIEADQRDLEIAGVAQQVHHLHQLAIACLLYTSPSPRD